MEEVAGLTRANIGMAVSTYLQADEDALAFFLERAFHWTADEFRSWLDAARKAGAQTDRECWLAVRDMAMATETHSLRIQLNLPTTALAEPAKGPPVKPNAEFSGLGPTE